MKTIYLFILSALLATGGFGQTIAGAAATATGADDQQAQKFYQVLRQVIQAADNEFEGIKGEKIKSIVGTKHRATIAPPNADAAYIEKNIWPTYHATLYKTTRYRQAKNMFLDYEKQLQCDLIKGWHIYETQSYSDKLMVYSVGTDANKLRGTEVTLTLRKNYDGLYIIELDVIKKK